MVGKYKVITLCGSTRFKNEFLEAQKRLTLEGNIVISVGLFGHSGDDEVWTECTKEMLDDMHKRKIDMADEIYVINVNGYIGSSTQSEIEYAKANGKPVRFLVNESESYIPELAIDDAIETLKRRRKDMITYSEIMKLSSDPSDSSFQQKYFGFYRLRRNEVWRAKYFDLMAELKSRGKASFEEVLTRLYQETGRIEASFSSKMLATIDRDKPIWDSVVLTVLAPLQLVATGKTTELRMQNIVASYERISCWYKGFIKTECAQEWINRFDREFPECKEFSSVKKIDFILWASR